MDQRVWRVGHVSAPLDFVSSEHRLYTNRFDDLQRQYGTLYCAEFRATCLRERLADLRPSTSFQAEFARHLGSSAPYIAAGFVGWRLREASALAPAVIRVKSGAGIVDLGDATLLRHLETEHAELLARHGIEHLDIEHVLTSHRAITQAISRSVYRDGAAGIRYYSHLDMQPCFALFEGRAMLETAGDPEPLTDDIPELLQVGSDYRLVLQRVEMSLVEVAEAEVQLGVLRLRHSRWREQIQSLHLQVLDSRESVEREGNRAVTILNKILNEFKEADGMLEGPERIERTEALRSQLVASLQRAVEATLNVKVAAEKLPHIRHEVDRLGEVARDLEQALTSFQAYFRGRRLPSDIDAETRFLLDAVRSRTSGEHPDS